MEMTRKCFNVKCPDCASMFDVRDTDELRGIQKKLRASVDNALHCLMAKVMIAGDPFFFCIAATIIPENPVRFEITRPDYEVKCPDCHSFSRQLFPIYHVDPSCCTTRDFGILESIEDCTVMLTLALKIVRKSNFHIIPKTNACHVIVRA